VKWIAPIATPARDPESAVGIEEAIDMSDIWRAIVEGKSGIAF
jgi:hypothetical protein